MDDSEDDDFGKREKFHKNQPYDESLDLPDSEEVASQYTPTPRVEIRKTDGGRPPPLKKADNDGQKSQKTLQKQKPKTPREDNDEEDYDSEDDDDDEDEEDNMAVEGAYNPADYENLSVQEEVKELFQYIARYTPQNMELDLRIQPFIPDYIPAVGDIDAFIKIPRFDGKDDRLGLSVLDEPCAKQSDPAVMDLTLRSFSKESNLSKATIKSIEHGDASKKHIDSWIKNVSELHKSKPPPTVHYKQSMPEIDELMEEWKPEFENSLKEFSLPTADCDVDLNIFADVICGLVDIPVHKSRIQSLHLLFTLYSEFQNSQHFQQENTEAPNNDGYNF